VGLHELITNAVALADTITKPIQPTIAHEPYAEDDGYGGVTYGAAVTRYVIASKSIKQVIGQSGQITVSNSQVLILANVAVNFRDRITLPDGTQPPIIGVQGVWNKDAGMYYTEVLF